MVNITIIELGDDTSWKNSCRVANGHICESAGKRLVHFTLREQSNVTLVLVVLDVLHTLIFGADLWKIVGIVPYLRHTE